MTWLERALADAEKRIYRESTAVTDKRRTPDDDPLSGSNGSFVNDPPTLGCEIDNASGDCQNRRPEPEGSYAAEHGGRWPIAPTSSEVARVHPYVVSHLLNRFGDNYGVCIACGTPWEMHGRPPVETWRIVEDIESVPLIRAASIISATVTEQIGILSAGDQLCPRCQRIARVHDGCICTFCADDGGLGGADYADHAYSGEGGEERSDPEPRVDEVGRGMYL
jgi:hypothetical protein